MGCNGPLEIFVGVGSGEGIRLSASFPGTRNPLFGRKGGAGSALINVYASSSASVPLSLEEEGFLDDFNEPRDN